MKLNYSLWLAIIASLPLLLPMSAIADDQKQDEKKQEGKKSEGSRHGPEVAPRKESHVTAPSDKKSGGADIRNRGPARTAPQRDIAPPPQQNAQPGKRAQRTQRSETVQSDGAPGKSQNPLPNGRIQHSQRNQSILSNVAPVTSGNVEPSNQTQRNQRNHIHDLPNQRTYNKDNNYGGLWFAENSHSDWRRDRNYYWNHHNYRWYEGGWLIIDGGFSPLGYNTGSTASNVQMSLANQGYYSGPIDGDIGPGTRAAIADYQGDHDLGVTGRINYSLLQSLQVQ